MATALSMPMINIIIIHAKKQQIYHIRLLHIIGAIYGPGIMIIYTYLMLLHHSQEIAVVS